MDETLNVPERAGKQAHSAETLHFGQVKAHVSELEIAAVLLFE
jgi:hypothetical protein